MARRTLAAQRARELREGRVHAARGLRIMVRMDEPEGDDRASWDNLAQELMNILAPDIKCWEL